MKSKKSDSSLYILIGILILIGVIFYSTDKSYIEGVLQFFVVLFTFFAAFSAYKSSQASERASRGLFLPILKLQVDEFDEEKFTLNVVNIGKQIAQDVSISIPNASAKDSDSLGFESHVEVIEIDEQQTEHITYDVHALSKNPKILVTYRDIFGGALETNGHFLFRYDDKKIPEQIETIKWEFRVDD